MPEAPSHPVSRLKVILAFLGVLVAPALGRSADSPAAAPPFTLEQILIQAKENNADLSAARFSVRAAEAQTKSAYGSFFPELTASADYAKSNTATSLESVAAGGSSRGGTQDEYSAGLTLRQSLFSGFQTKAQLDSSKASLSGAQSDLALAEAQVAKEAKTAFSNLLTTQENINLLKAIRDRRAENKRLIGLRFDAGRENRGAFLRAVAQLSQAEFEIRRAERARKLNQRALAKVMGTENFEALALTGTFRYNADLSPADFKTLALEAPDYKKQESTWRKSRAGIVESRAALFPDLSASGAGRRRGSEYPPDKDSWTVGLSVSYSVFSGLSDYFKLKQAQFQSKQASAALESKRREIEVSLEDAYSSFEDAAGAAEVQKQFLKAAEERAQIARAQYSTGLLSFQDWDLIETDLVNAQKQNLSAQHDAMLAEAEWARVQGKGF